MAHDKIYGVCENKCFVETMSKEQIEKKFNATVRRINAALNQSSSVDINADDCLLLVNLVNTTPNSITFTLNLDNAINRFYSVDTGQDMSIVNHKVTITISSFSNYTNVFMPLLPPSLIS